MTPASAEYQRLSGFQLYLSPMFGRTTLGGDFDGNHVIISDRLDEVNQVPRFDGGRSIGGAIGIRNKITRTIDGGLEFAYTESRLPAEWAGSPASKSTLSFFDMSVRAFFLSHKPIQPSMMLGIHTAFLTVPNGRTRAPFTRLEDAEYQGIGLTFGGGLSYFLHRRLSLDFKTIYRLVSFDEVNDLEIRDGLSAGSLNLSVGFSLHLFGTKKSPDEQVNPHDI